MPTKKKPVFDEVIDDVRVRIFSTREGYEAIFNDDDFADPEAHVMVYPRIGEPSAWAHQARLEYKPD